MNPRMFQLLFFLVVLAGFGLAFAPASLVAPSKAQGFSYQRADGTIWDARFERARMGPFDLGAVTWKVSFGDLFKGRFKGDLTAEGGALVGQGSVLANWKGDRRLVAPNLRLSGAPLSPSVRLAGDTIVTGLDIAFENGGCSVAAGTVQSDVLAQNPDVLKWTGPQLAGGASCSGKDAVIALAGADGPETVNVNLTLNPNGAGAWRAEVRSSRVEAQMALAAAGFAASPQGPALMIKESRWAGLF